jgi:diguanylate cyclase (GGDEF)-like protein
MKRQFNNPFRIADDQPELVKSQISALARQVPILYVILVLNAMLTAIMHVGVAPLWLSVIVPLPVVIIGILRSISWVRLRDKVLPHDVAVRRLRSTVYLSGVLGAVLCAWALSMFSYADSMMRLHTAFFVSMTVIPCIFSLTHLRAAALLTAIVALFPSFIFFSFAGEPVLLAIMANFLVVILAMLRVLWVHSGEFESLIHAREQLLQRQQVTEHLSDQNFRLANLDALTGLPNRRAFFQQASVMTTGHKTDGLLFAVAVIDLDGFKAINDCHGHGAGDEILIQVARRLEMLPSETVFSARLGGDEFALLVTGAIDEQSLTRLGFRICQMLGQKYNLSHVDATISASIGFAVCPEAGTETERLLENADYALMHAKQNRRGTPMLFNAELGDEMRRLNLIDQYLRNAELERELTIMLQPIIYSDSGALRGHEVLARWRSQELGQVPPMQFIKAAERSEMIHQVTLALLRKTLDLLKTLPKGASLSFNLSARDVASPETVLQILAMVRSSGIEPRSMTFEITETAFMVDFRQAADVLNLLRNMGCRVALDDFGSGYSSLSYVHMLPLDAIKIDRSFVQEVESSEVSRGIIRTIVDLCRNLKLQCVVEGVETEGQVAALRQLGCDAMQGFYFAEPFAPDVLLEPASRVAEPAAG